MKKQKNSRLTDFILKEWCKKIPRGFPIIENGKFSDENDEKVLKSVIEEIIKKKNLNEARMWAHTDASYIPNKRFERDLEEALGDKEIVQSLYEMPLQYNDNPRLSRDDIIMIVKSDNIEEIGKLKELQNKIRDIPKLERELKAAKSSEKRKINTKIKRREELADMISLRTNHTVWQSEALPGYIFFVPKSNINMFTQVGGRGSGNTSRFSSSSTDIKEAVVCYGAYVNDSELNSIIELIKESPNTSLQKEGFAPYEISDSKKYYGIELKEFLEYVYNLNLSLMDTKLKNSLLNSLTSSKAISNLFPDKISADRGESFKKIRDKATSLIKDQDLSVSADKWCPADIYLSTAPLDDRALDSIESLDELNNLFANYTNEEDKIVAISLKEEKALQGKSTSFFKVVKNLDLPKREFEKTGLPLSTKKYLSDIQEQVGKILSKHGISRPNSLNIQKVLSGHGIPELQKIPVSQRGNKNPKLNPNFNHDAYNELIEFSKQLKLDGQKHINEYNKYRKLFYKNTSKYGTVSPEYNARDLPIDTIIKKTGVYKLALFISDERFFSQIKRSLSKKNIGSQTMKKYDNPFVALCAYAIGISGLNPTFWKVTGSETGGDAHILKLRGNTVLLIDSDFSMEIRDNENSTDMSLKYIVSTEIEDSDRSTQQKKYSVIITFRYDKEEIRIEVNEFKEEK